MGQSQGMSQPRPLYRAQNPCPFCDQGNRLVRTVWRVSDLTPRLDDRPGPRQSAEFVGIVSCNNLSGCTETTRRMYDAIVPITNQITGTPAGGH